MTNVFFIVVVFSITRFINNHPIHWVDYSSSGLITKVLILFSYLSVSIFLVNCSVSLNSNQSQLILLLSMFTTVIPLIYLMSFLPKKESSFIAVIASSQAQVKPEQAASPIQKEGIETVHQHGDFHNDTVWLDYINDEGGLTFKRIEYQSTHGDKFKAFCHLANGIRYFEFNKIHSIFDTKMLPIDRDAWISFHSND